MSSDVTAGAVRLCAVEDVAEGEAKGFETGVDALPKVIVLHREGRYVGYRDGCPHVYFGVQLGVADRGYFNASKTHLVCYGHGALFDPLTGKCVWGPPEGKSLRSVPLIIEDGAIWWTPPPAQA